MTKPRAAGVELPRSASSSLSGFPSFVRFWLASTVSDAGSYVGALALSVVVVLGLGGGAADVGLVNAARWLAYPLLGLFAGVWVDRLSARLVMAYADIGRAFVLGLIGILGITGVLSIPLIVVLVFVVGMLTLMSDAAFQSLVPQLVPRPLLTRANARLEQSGAVAQTAGPALAGGIVQLLTAPFALLLNASAFAVSGLVVMTIRDAGRPPSKPPVGTRMAALIGEGLTWIRGHRTLLPLATSTAVWFTFSSMFGAVFAVYALREIGTDAAGLGFLLAVAGVGAVLGTSLSTTLESRLKLGRALILGRGLHPAAIALIAVAPVGAGGDALTGSLVIAAGQFLFGLAIGIEGPLELGYRQAVTPDALIARMSATLRSVNRTMIVVGASVGGVIADAVGNRSAIAIVAAGMLLAFGMLAVSSFRHASAADALPDEGELPG